MQAIRRDRICQIKGDLISHVAQLRSYTALLVWQLIDKMLGGFAARPNEPPIWIGTVLNCSQVLRVTAGNDPQGLLFQETLKRTWIIKHSHSAPCFSTIRTKRWLSSLRPNTAHGARGGNIPAGNQYCAQTNLDEDHVLFNSLSLPLPHDLNHYYYAERAYRSSPTKGSSLSNTLGPAWQSKETL